MYYDLIRIEFSGDYKIKCEFENGKKGLVDFNKLIKEKPYFNKLKDKNYFIKAYINEDLKVLCWPDGLDIAPETLYSWATKEQLPEWLNMTKPQAA